MEQCQQEVSPYNRTSQAAVGRYAANREIGVITSYSIHYTKLYDFFSFHQSFSTDHPQKGETVRYGLHMVNEGPIPLAPGRCASYNFV